MRWLVCLVLAALAGVAGGCADNTYSPFAFKEFPGYTPPGAKAPADQTLLETEAAQPTASAPVTTSGAVAPR